jgi:uncharacterized protein
VSAPTPPSARLESLDVLRGAALLGVFVENAQHFFAPTYRASVAQPAAGFADHATLWLIQIVLEHKLYALFALLFGYGIALQMARAGPGFVALHVWRMGGLLLIGMFHEALLWSGDILATYALLGLLLLPFHGLPLRTLVFTAAFALAAPTLALAALTVATPVFAAGAERARVAADVVAFGYPLRQALFAFAMFLLGLAAARARGQADDPLPALRRALPWLFALGGVASLAHVALVDLSGASSVSWTAVAAEALVAIAGPALAFAYAGALLRALERPRWQRALRPLAAAGRLSLTNYLMQSAIGVLLFARLGEIPPPLGVALSGAVFGLQVAASVAWLRRFRFGPAEWLWRALSYGRLP